MFTWAAVIRMSVLQLGITGGLHMAASQLLKDGKSVCVLCYFHTSIAAVVIIGSVVVAFAMAVVVMIVPSIVISSIIVVIIVVVSVIIVVVVGHVGSERKEEVRFVSIGIMSKRKDKTTHQRQARGPFVLKQEKMVLNRKGLKSSSFDEGREPAMTGTNAEKGKFVGVSVAGKVGPRRPPAAEGGRGSMSSGRRCKPTVTAPLI